MKKYIWYVLLVICMAAAGAIYPFTKLLALDFSPLTLAFLRYFIALFPMLPFFISALRRNTEKITFGDTAAMIGLGVFGIGSFSILFYTGVMYSTGTNGSIIVNTQPIIAVFLTPLLLRTKFEVKKLAAVIIGVAGMVIVVTGGLFTGLKMGSEFLQGNLLLLASAFMLTIYTILTKPFVAKFDGTIPTFIAFASATAVLALAALIREKSLVDLSLLTIKSAGFLIFISFISTAMFFLIFNRAIHALGVVEALGFKLLIPVFGSGLSILILGERPKIATIIGACVVIASIIFLQFRTTTQTKIELDEETKL